MIKATNRLTGEIYELADDTPQDIRSSWQILSETIKTLEAAKDKLKPKIADMVDAKGVYDFGDAMFRQLAIQRTTYDKAVMRDLLDEDTLDLLLAPDKTLVDNYLKENLADLGDVSTKLRDSMIPVGRPYTTIRLEKVK